MDNNEWACATCTFLNKPHKQVCDMCGKSKPTHTELSRRATSALVAATAEDHHDTPSPQQQHQHQHQQSEAAYVIDALENFLRGPQWKNTMNTFVNSHCAMFAVIDGEHGHGQHEVFRNFRETVDGLLEGVLSDLGCSPEIFIDALEKRQRRPEGGPRDAAINEMVRTLMTFERFDIFKVMMHDRNRKLEDQEYGQASIARATRDASRHRSSSTSSERYRQRSASKSQEAPSSGWNCICCSFYNENHRENCEMCKNPKIVSRDGTNGNNANNLEKVNNTNSGQSQQYAQTHISSNHLHNPRSEIRGGSSTTTRPPRSATTTSAKKRIEIKPSDRKTPFQALCHENYDAQKDTEMSMKMGEMVIVIDNKSSVDWWYAECPTRGAEGWIPVTFLTVDQETAADQDKRLRTLSASLRKHTAAATVTSTRSSNRQEKTWAQKSSRGDDDDEEENAVQRKLKREHMLINRKSSTASVDEETFRTMMPVQEDRKIRSVFEEYDRNRSGSLVHGEFAMLFADMDLPCSEQEIDESIMRLKTFTELEGDVDGKELATTMNTNEVTVNDMAQSLRRTGRLKSNGKPEPLTLLEFYNLWRMHRDDSNSPVTRVTNRLCDLRVRLGERRSIFFGFTYDDWQSANNLNRAKVSNWSQRDVAKWFAFENDLAPMRQYLKRGSLSELDGETLLEVDREYMINDLGVKSIHIRKMIKAINKLRVANGLAPLMDENSGSSTKQNDYSRQRSPSNGSTTSEIELQDSAVAKGGRERSGSRRVRQKNVGAWRRGHLIGQGAYGKVYQGFSLEDGSLIAVKQILTTMDDETRREVENEISVMSRLKHECIVRYLGYQWDQPNQQLFIFTEWVPGGSLSDILKKFGKLNVHLTARYTKQMLVGLDYLHRHDVIHLDIKPGNVLIDNLGCVKLADFGASRKLVDGQSVRVGGNSGSGGGGGGGGKENDTVEMLGTPYFMAPEIIRQERHGRKADIWSVAGTVLNMFTGVPPWSNSSQRSSNVMALLLQIERAKGPPPYPDTLQRPFGNDEHDVRDWLIFLCTFHSSVISLAFFCGLFFFVIELITDTHTLFFCFCPSFILLFSNSDQRTKDAWSYARLS
jgi:hypothetical protein